MSMPIEAPDTYSRETVNPATSNENMATLVAPAVAPNMPNTRRYRPTPAKTFQCRGYGECRMVFSRSEHLARHIRKHTGERPFTCHCSKQFSRLDNLRQHAQTVHADKQEQNERMMRDLTSLHATMAAANKATQPRSNRRAPREEIKQEENTVNPRPGTSTGYEVIPFVSPASPFVNPTSPFSPSPPNSTTGSPPDPVQVVQQLQVGANRSRHSLRLSPLPSPSISQHLNSRPGSNSPLNQGYFPFQPSDQSQMPDSVQERHPRSHRPVPPPLPLSSQNLLSNLEVDWALDSGNYPRTTMDAPPNWETNSHRSHPQDTMIRHFPSTHHQQSPNQSPPQQHPLPTHVSDLLAAQTVQMIQRSNPPTPSSTTTAQSPDLTLVDSRSWSSVTTERMVQYWVEGLHAQTPQVDSSQVLRHSHSSTTTTPLHTPHHPTTPLHQQQAQALQYAQDLQRQQQAQMRRAQAEAMQQKEEDYFAAYQQQTSMMDRPVPMDGYYQHHQSPIHQAFPQHQVLTPQEHHLGYHTPQHPLVHQPLTPLPVSPHDPQYQMQQQQSMFLEQQQGIKYEDTGMLLLG